MVTNPISLARYISGLRGASRPFLAEASDGGLYVVKYCDPSTDQLPLFRESMGTILFEALGLRVPPWRPLKVTMDFLNTVKAANVRVMFNDNQIGSQPVFGSRYLGETFARSFEILPRSAFSKIKSRDDFLLAWVLDVCAQHSDNRHAVFCELANGRLAAHFIDHGRLFEPRGYDLSRQIIAAMYLDRRMYGGLPSQCWQTAISSFKSLDSDFVWNLARAVPVEWLSVQALLTLTQFLDRISTIGFVNEVADRMIQLVAGLGTLERPTNDNVRPQPDALLPPSI